MLGQSIGPVIGGIITEYFGFHAIFWFLFMLRSCTLLLIFLFLPETLRHIAGNGTAPLYGVDQPILSGSLEKHWKRNPTDDEASSVPKITPASILPPPPAFCSKKTSSSPSSSSPSSTPSGAW